MDNDLVAMVLKEVATALSQDTETTNTEAVHPSALVVTADSEELPQTTPWPQTPVVTSFSAMPPNDNKDAHSKNQAVMDRAVPMETARAADTVVVVLLLGAMALPLAATAPTRTAN